MIQDQAEADIIYALRRYKNDYGKWSPKRLRFSFTPSPATPDTPLFRRCANFRVINAPVWLKLIWARQNRLQKDLLTP